MVILSQWGPATVWLLTFFYVQQNKENHTGLEQLEVSKSLHNLHFWVKYPFN